MLLFFKIRGDFGGNPPFSNHTLDIIDRAVKKSLINADTFQFRSCFVSRGVYDLGNLNSHLDALIDVSKKINDYPQFTSLIRIEERNTINHFLQSNYLLNRDSIYMYTSVYLCFTIFIFLSKFETVAMLLN